MARKKVGRFAGLKVKRFGGQKRLAKISPTLAKNKPARIDCIRAKAPFA